MKVKDVLYCDGGIVASNPTAIAIHEARTLFPDVPIELVGKFSVVKGIIERISLNAHFL